MAITEKARDLGVEVDLQGAETGASRLPNGLIKTGRGLVVPPSTSGVGKDTKTGELARLTQGEKNLFGVQDPQSAPPAEQGRKPRSRKTKESAAPARPSTVKVRLAFEDLGVLPFEYAHRIRGEGVTVLGLSELSYTPRVASVSADGTVTGAIRFADSPDEVWAYLGQRFTDVNGVENIILVALPRKE